MGSAAGLDIERFGKSSTEKINQSLQVFKQVQAGVGLCTTVWPTYLVALGFPICLEPSQSMLELLCRRFKMTRCSFS